MPAELKNQKTGTCRNAALHRKLFFTEPGFRFNDNRDDNFIRSCIFAVIQTTLIFAKSDDGFGEGRKIL